MDSPVELSRHEAVSAALGENQTEFAAFVRSRIRPQDADEVLQLAAARGIERAATLEDPDRVVAWLYRIHRNLIIDVMRAKASEQKYADTHGELPEFADAALADADFDELCRCIMAQTKRLRPSYASILNLVDADGLPLSEAARELDVSVNNATVRLHRARKALREKMLEHCGVTDASECASCRCIDDNCCAA